MFSPSPAGFVYALLSPSCFALPYLQNTLSPKSVDFRTCILSSHAGQISSGCFFPSGIPWFAIHYTSPGCLLACGYGRVRLMLLLFPCLFSGTVFAGLLLWSPLSFRIFPSFHFSGQTPHGIDNASWYVLNYLHLLLSWMSLHVFVSLGRYTFHLL